MINAPLDRDAISQVVNVIASILKQQNNVKKRQVTTVIDYIRNDNLCKSIQLLNYFGEKDIEACGLCSVCIAGKKLEKTETNQIKNAIIKLLEKKSLLTTQLFMETPYRNNQLVEVILKTCRSQSKLCIASNITTGKESILTKTIAEWKTIKLDINKQPSIFLLS